jgi:hypothetical protein
VTDTYVPIPAVLISDYPVDGPLRQLTPWRRLEAAAASVDVQIFYAPEVESAGLAGVVGAGFKDDDLHGLVVLATDLDEDLRTDVLAFAVSVFAADGPRLLTYPGARLGIRRERLSPAETGPGRLAEVIVGQCGRKTPSATFPLEPILVQGDEPSA